MITDRFQGWYPRANNIGANATIVVKQQDGKTATYTIPWDVSGTSVTAEGPVQSPAISASSAARKNMYTKRGVTAARALADPERALNPWRLWAGVRPPRIETPQPNYMARSRSFAPWSR
jgi:hypothetical protein